MAKILTGVVVSTKTDKTIVIEMHVRKTHPLYRKQYSVTNKIMAHDEKNEAKPGDKVTVVETKPISKRKRFVLKEILSHADLTSEDKAIIEQEEVQE